MARRKDSSQKAAMRKMMRDYLKNNDISIKDGTDVNSIMRDMMSGYVFLCIRTGNSGRRWYEHVK